MTQPSFPERARTARIVPGLILIGLGVLFLLEQFLPIGNWFLFLLGIVFLVSYFLTRREGLLWPAGILTGLGGGTIVAGSLGMSGQLEAGVVLLGLAAGFFAIYVFDQAFTPPTPTGPLWAGAGVGLFALLLVLTGLGILPEDVWALIGRVWPIALILVGGVLIVGAFRRSFDN